MAQLCAGVAHELMLLYYIATASCLRVRKRDRMPGGQTSRQRRQLFVVEGWARVRLDTPAWAISSWWRPWSRLRVKSSDRPQILFSVPLPATGWAAMSSGSRAIDSAMLQAEPASVLGRDRFHDAVGGFSRP
jgi:hypothetical protein